MKGETKARVFGSMLVLVGLVANPWFLATVFTSGHRIRGSFSLAAIYAAEALCLVLGGLLLWKPGAVMRRLPAHVRIPLRWDVAVSCVSALLLVVLVSFGYGVAVGEFHHPPYMFCLKAYQTARVLWLELGLGSELPAHIYRARYEGEGVVVCDRERACDGVTLITAPWEDESGWNLYIRLIDLDGAVLHEWRIDPKEIWPTSPHDDVAAGSKNDKRKTYVHGSVLLPGGDVVFNLEHLGLVRMNRQAEVVWKLPYRTHHSVFLDTDGKLWVCGEKWHEKRAPEFLGCVPPFVEETILKVSLDGEIEREISILKCLYDSGYYPLLFVDQVSNTRDMTHANDAEVLSESQAAAFDSLEAGDIVTSLRHLNTVLVIDGKTERIKWSMTYPFIGQHDPDFSDDGVITVFDNHIGRTDPESDLGGSRILRVDPATDKVTTIYGRGEGEYFFTSGGGKHQMLPNGNILITESRAGRVFEVTPSGDVVWSWIAPRWNDRYVPEIMEGTRYRWDEVEFLKER